MRYAAVKQCLALMLGISGMLLPASTATASTATYDVVFKATWSSLTHIGAYPGGAHFSPLIGAVHNDQVLFWTPGGQATPGIEEMAETGGTSILKTEIQTAISASNAMETILGSGTGSPGSTTTSFNVSTDFPLVTLVTMVAPSPDWFVGVSGLDLRDGGAWKSEITVDLHAYDSGTDSGLDFTSANDDTSPQDAIALVGVPFTGKPPLGSFTFTRVVPEPSTLVLAMLGSLGLLLGWRRKRRAA